MFFLHVPMCTMCMPGAHKDQEASDWRNQIKRVVSEQVGAGNHAWSSAKTSITASASRLFIIKIKHDFKSETLIPLLPLNNTLSYSIYLLEFCVSLKQNPDLYISLYRPCYQSTGYIITTSTRRRLGLFWFSFWDRVSLVVLVSLKPAM